MICSCRAPLIRIAFEPGPSCHLILNSGHVTTWLGRQYILVGRFHSNLQRTHATVSSQTAISTDLATTCWIRVSSYDINTTPQAFTLLDAHHVRCHTIHNASVLKYSVTCEPHGASTESHPSVQHLHEKLPGSTPAAWAVRPQCQSQRLAEPSGLSDTPPVPRRCCCQALILCGP